jgi:hypothetical protein
MVAAVFTLWPWSWGQGILRWGHFFTKVHDFAR